MAVSPLDVCLYNICVIYYIDIFLYIYVCIFIYLYIHILFCVILKVSDISKEGYLWKQSRHIKSWRKRWVVLCGNKLYTFKKEKRYLDPTETLNLSYSNLQITVGSDKHKYAFILSDIDNSITFSTKSESQRNEWKVAILKAKTSSIKDMLYVAPSKTENIGTKYNDYDLSLSKLGINSELSVSSTFSKNKTPAPPLPYGISYKYDYNYGKKKSSLFHDSSSYNYNKNETSISNNNIVTDDDSSVFSYQQQRLTLIDDNTNNNNTNDNDDDSEYSSLDSITTIDNKLDDSDDDDDDDIVSVNTIATRIF